MIAHISDVHLRDTQYATSRRGQDFYSAFVRAVEAACDSPADVIVCTGDNFDKSRPSAQVIGQFVSIDKLLVKRGKRMLCITGNHDYSSPTWLETLFPVPADTAVGVVPLDGLKVDINGFRFGGIPPYSAPAFKGRMAELDVFVKDCDVVLYHGFVTGIAPVFCGDKNVLDVADLPCGPDTKAILLGDIHVQAYVERKNGSGNPTLVGYPGSLEMCSASESTEKSIPLIRVDDSGAKVESNIPLIIRPFIHRKVKDAAALDELIKEATAVAAEHPVVQVEFDRSLPQTVTRLHATLDAQRAVIRCHPLPMDKVEFSRAVTAADQEDLGMEHFISKRFSDDPLLESLALALFQRGEEDAANIMTGFIEGRLEAMNVRD